MRVRRRERRRDCHLLRGHEIASDPRMWYNAYIVRISRDGERLRLAPGWGRSSLELSCSASCRSIQPRLNLTNPIRPWRSHIACMEKRDLPHSVDKGILS
jgi:hypothetical protein